MLARPRRLHQISRKVPGPSGKAPFSDEGLHLQRSTFEGTLHESLKGLHLRKASSGFTFGRGGLKGLEGVLRGLKGLQGASRGLEGGLKPSTLKGPSRGLEGGFKGA